jgi:hypothetical protein
MKFSTLLMLLVVNAADYTSSEEYYIEEEFMVRYYFIILCIDFNRFFSVSLLLTFMLAFLSVFTVFVYCTLFWPYEYLHTCKKFHYDVDRKDRKQENE